MSVHGDRHRISETRPMPLPYTEIMAEPRWLSMAAEGRGVLISFLFIVWRDGGIPADPLLAARLSALDSPIVTMWWDALTPWFFPHPTRPGLLIAPCILEAMIFRLKRRISANAARSRMKRNRGRQPEYRASGESLESLTKSLCTLADKIGIRLSDHQLI